MKRKLLLLIMTMSLSVAFSLSPAWGETKAERAKAMKGGGPIEIVSDRMDAYNQEKLVVFSGNVVATQKDKVIKADRILVYYKKDGKGSAKPASASAPEETGDLDRIEAKGNVRITQGDKIVTGEDGIFYNDEQKIIMTGNPVMREGNNVIKGDRIVVLLDEDRGVVESAKDKRVTATIYPDEAKQKKK